MIKSSKNFFRRGKGTDVNILENNSKPSGQVETGAVLGAHAEEETDSSNYRYDSLDSLGGHGCGCILSIINLLM